MREAFVLLFATLPLHGQTLYPPDAATMKEIEAKTAELKSELATVKYDKSDQDAESKWADVAICLKAAEWIVAHNEWYTKDSAKHTLATIEAGLARANALNEGKTPWRDIRNKPGVRGYVSWIDGSVQPYSVTLPPGYGTDGKKYRLDIVLHGRNATLTEAGFIGGRELAKPADKGNDYVILEPYGRGNNAYRWAGEQDVHDALAAFLHDEKASFLHAEKTSSSLNLNRVVLRGFSMGGAGAWHIGLHHPFKFNAMNPGAGFTVTRGYIKDFPATIPDYIERCLHIYDAVDCAENIATIPCVAYSGEKDPQIAAVRHMEARLKTVKNAPTFTHIIGTGLEHKMPPEWWMKVDEKLREHLAAKERPSSFRHVLWTPRYGRTPAGDAIALEKQYEKAVIEGTVKGDEFKVTTSNIRAIDLSVRDLKNKQAFDIDGAKLIYDEFANTPVLIREKGQWRFWERKDGYPSGIKMIYNHGPIDDAFMERFAVVAPSKPGMHEAISNALGKRLGEFDRVWNRYLRAKMPVVRENDKEATHRNLVLFGDPVSNPLIATYLPKLPIVWTKEKLTVNGRNYDPATHFPVMIYPLPNSFLKYLVLNSGHTFGETDLKGTNALLYPRLGDWAVLKLAPTKDDPHHTEVVDAGIFDENWQFEKKK